MSKNDSSSDTLPAMWKDNSGSGAAKRFSNTSMHRDMMAGIRPESVLGGEYQVEVTADPSPYGSVRSPGFSGYSSEKIARFRESRRFQKRGGWRRWIIALAALLCLIVLAVGLGVGLRHKHTSSV